jgi:hypothetical protein
MPAAALQHDPKKLQTFWEEIMRQNKEVERNSDQTQPHPALKYDVCNGKSSQHNKLSLSRRAQHGLQHDRFGRIKSLV